MESSVPPKKSCHSIGTFGNVLIGSLHPSSAIGICNEYEKENLRAFGTVIGQTKLPTAKGRMSDCYIDDVYFLRRAFEGAPPTRINLVSLDAQRHKMYCAKGRFKKWAPPKAPRAPKELSNIKQTPLGNVSVHSGCKIVERVQADQPQRASILSDQSASARDLPAASAPEDTVASATNVNAPTCFMGSTVFTNGRLVVETAQTEDQHEAQLLLNLSGGLSVSTSQDPVTSAQIALVSGPGITLDVRVDAEGSVRNDIQVVNPALAMAPPRPRSAPARTTPTATSRIVHNNSTKEVQPDEHRRRTAIVTREIGLDTVPLPDDTTNYVEMFEHFFHMDRVKSDLLPNTNVKMRALGES